MPERAGQDTRATGGTPVDRALRRLEHTGGDVLSVVERGRRTGGLALDTLRRARDYGMGRVAVRELVFDDVRLRASQARRTRPDDLTELLERRLPPRLLAALRRIGEIAAENREDVFLVGGAVRDLLLAREVTDLDIVVEGDAVALAHRVGSDVRAHPAFRTASLRLSDGTRLDLASARRERYREPAALPEVEPADLEQDLSRRDFTIHALAVRLSPDGFGRLIDPFGGRADLRRGVVCVLHGLSMVEDPTRALRAARIAGRFGFRIESRTAGGVRTALRLGVFDRLSPARLLREVARLLGEPRPQRGVRHLARLGLLAVLHPRLELSAATLRRLARLEALLERYGTLADAAPVESWVVALGLLLLDASRGQLASALRRLAPDRRTRRVLESTARDVRRLERVLSRGGSRASRIAAACRSCPVEVLLVARAATESRPVRAALLRYLEELRPVQPDIDGRDLLRAGVPPGPGVARGLEAALGAKLDGIAADAGTQLQAALRAARRA